MTVTWRVAQWITRPTSDRKAPDPSPGALAAMGVFRPRLWKSLLIYVLASRTWLENRRGPVRANVPFEVQGPTLDAEHARTRTWSLLIRSQTRYPLRDAPG